MTALHELSAIELVVALRDGRLRPSELAAHYLARIEARRDLGAFVEVTADAALRRAAALEQRPPAGALWGLPLADKDLVARAGVPTRYGSAARAEHVPAVSDPLADALDAEGVVNLGKTATSEFGLTGYTEPLAGAPARDPWDPANGAGGSSGGAAVAVAAEMLPAAIGSDGGGSIRIPAATVGIVGLKPSRGRLPIGSGLDAAEGLAVTGPLARTAADAALLLDALVGLAPYPFATGAPGHGPFLPAAVAQPLGGRAVAVTTVSPWDDDVEIAVDPSAVAAVAWAAAALDREGAAVSDLDWSPRGYGAFFRVLWRASAARLPLSDAELELVEGPTAWLAREGRALSASAALDAIGAARAFERETVTAFAPYDAVLTPALAQSPRPVGWYDRDDPERGFDQQVQYTPYSSFVNVTGQPAVTIPVTRDATGHPVSVQLVGRPGGEAALLTLAATLEAARGPLPRPPAW